MVHDCAFWVMDSHNNCEVCFCDIFINTILKVNKMKHAKKYVIFLLTIKMHLTHQIKDTTLFYLLCSCSNRLQLAKEMHIERLRLRWVHNDVQCCSQKLYSIAFCSLSKQKIILKSKFSLFFFLSAKLTHPHNFLIPTGT